MLLTENEVPNEVKKQRDRGCNVLGQIGIADLRYPIIVLDKSRQQQKTVASVTISAGLSHRQNGIDTGDFIEILEKHRGEFTVRTMPTVLRDVAEKLKSEYARIEATFPYFLEKSAPESGVRALMDYECSFVGEVNFTGDDFVLGVRVPVTRLSPSSKSISDYGAQNQRSYLTIQVRGNKNLASDQNFVWIEELIVVAEKSASAPIYALLKRSDERHVTMQAYDNPVSVEDMVRNVSGYLIADNRVGWFNVQAVSFESTQNHNRFAQLEWTRP